MAKKQIRINQSDIRRMIKEAVDSMGYPKVSGGAFSMDSPLGQEIKDHAQKYTRPGKDWLDREKWKDTWMSRDDGNDKRDRFAMDEFGDEKAESDRLDKPFGEFDDEIENQWDDEPGYAEEPDDDEIAGIDEGRKIRLNEKQLREFVSYSVSRLLKEGWRPFYDKHGEWDGDEYTSYGSDSFVFEPDIDRYLDDDADFPEYPKVRVEYTKTEGMKGDGYSQPDDPDEYTLDGWDIVNKENLPQEVIEAVKMYMKNDFDLEEEVVAHEGYLEEAENRGIMTHFDGKDTFKPKNPYEDMTWDEYCKAKKGDCGEKKSLHDTDYPEEKKNRGIKIQFDGKKHEETPEDKERAEHMFDDDYWVNKMNLTKEDLAEMVNRSVRLIAERINLNEISKGLIDRAREAAHKDMMRNFGDSKIRNKRDRQWRKFTDEYGRLDSEERDSICPHVDEEDLVNMPEDTYVVLNGDGRDAISANFRTSYSGRAGTKEQCEEYVKRFYDMGANWEYLPEIVPLEDYLNSKHRR